MAEQRDKGSVRSAGGMNGGSSGEERRTVGGDGRVRERSVDRSDDLGPRPVDPA